MESITVLPGKVFIRIDEEEKIFAVIFADDFYDLAIKIFSQCVGIVPDPNDLLRKHGDIIYLSSQIVDKMNPLKLHNRLILINFDSNEIGYTGYTPFVGKEYVYYGAIKNPWHLSFGYKTKSNLRRCCFDNSDSETQCFDLSDDHSLEIENNIISIIKRR